MRTSEERMHPPLIGVLVSGSTIANQRNQRAGVHMRLMREANQRLKARLFFFTVSSIDNSANRIEGTFWDAKAGRWKQQSFPLPNILYVRGGGDSPSVEVLVNKVKKCGVVLNYPPFDKWEVYQNLSRFADIKEHLPDTAVYRSPEDIRAMLDAYGAVYLKPARGRKGRNVIRIRQDGQGFQVSFFIDRGASRGLKQFSLPSLESVVNYATALYGGDVVLVQQPIDLMTWEGKLVDLRAEMARNPRGEVEIVAIAARIGGNQSPITTHAQVATLDWYLSEVCGYPPAIMLKVKEDIRRFLMSVYTCIEAPYGRYAEIGIDFGLDKQGKIWFIECNSQSAKVSLARAYGTRAVYRSILTVLSYGVHAYRQRQRVRAFRRAAQAAV